jgi:hypothetical protein
MNMNQNQRTPIASGSHFAQWARGLTPWLLVSLIIAFLFFRPTP